MPSMPVDAPPPPAFQSGVYDPFHQQEANDRARAMAALTPSGLTPPRKPVRKWAGAQELDDMGVNEETKAQRRMREIAGRAVEGLDDAPWDLDGFGPQDEQERPSRGNVRSWH